MALSTLYSFFEFGQINTVSYDTGNPIYITSNSSPAISGPAKPANGIQVGAPYCGGTTKYIYRVQSLYPYAYYEAFPNSTYCGYVAPSCDISEINFEVTDETATDANDGSVNLFVTSSFAPIVYYLFNGDLSINLSNSTGYFDNLPPDTYTIRAQDANGCDVTKSAIVAAFDDATLTHWKYKLDFETIDKPGLVKLSWQVRLIDTRNNYDNTQYPKDVKGTDKPLILKQGDSAEDKTTTIISRSVDISLLYDGISFTTDEFTKAPEKQWKVEIWVNGAVDFIGWMLPDETQDYYQDPNYPFTLTATDGLPSLKGNLWGDGSGGNGYTSDQVPQYALLQWCKLLKQCLDQLGYDYGRITILSSLRYNNSYDSDLWSKIATWSDLMYGTDGVPNSTYECLELLVKGMGLSIIQHKGKFVLLNWNDLFYYGKPLNALEFERAFYTVDLQTGTTTGSGSTVAHPVYQSIGFDQPFLPMGTQPLNYDKAYNIKGNVDFNILALLYPNPSFEIGSVEGAIPLGFTETDNIDGRLHYDTTAYDGDWELRVVGTMQMLRVLGSPVVQAGDIFFMEDDDRWLILDPIEIDQVNKKLNMSFVWRPVQFDTDTNVCPTYTIFFQPAGGSDVYIYSNSTKTGINNTGWYGPDHDHAFIANLQLVTDYQAWNSFSITTDVFPGGGLGTLSIAFRTPIKYGVDGFQFPDDGILHTIDYDNFEISLSDASDGYSKQVGETHLTNLVTNPQANQKEVPLKLFTYPQNKRIAGNVFTQTPYETGVVANNWNYSLKSLDPLDRLPATITKSIARNYARPMQIFEGDLICAYVAYYGVFALRFYPNTLFRAFNVSLDARNATASVTIVEIDDSDAQYTYKYVAKFEKSSRKNISG